MKKRQIVILFGLILLVKDVRFSFKFILGIETTDIHFDPVKALIGSNPSALPMLTMGGQSPITQKKESKERPTKWGNELEKTFKPPALPGIARGLCLEDVEYLIRLYRLDELTKKKNLGQLEIEDKDVRSPSPEPIYDKNGKRLNTTELRVKDDMKREIHTLIEECMAMNPKFIPPPEYKNMKKTRKIYLPETSEGQNNYAGIILGHGGETQKRLETKSGCKISIRGRQSYMVKFLKFNLNRDADMIMILMSKLMY